MKTITLATFNNSFQATILQNALNNVGIQSFTKNENLSSLLPTPGFQIEIHVFEDDYEKASDIFRRGFPNLSI